MADLQARIIRHMFAADVASLPEPLAAKLQVFLEQHIGLRAYYPTTEEFYASVRSGHLERPLPIDALLHAIEVRERHWRRGWANPAAVRSWQETSLARQATRAAESAGAFGMLCKLFDDDDEEAEQQQAECPPRFSRRAVLWKFRG